MTPKNALDHVVVGVPDLGSARARLSALGFAVQADAHHPFGTGNCNVFFENGTYFEPLAITDRDAELAALKTTNPFVRRFDAYRFRHGYGPMMAAFTTDSASRMQDHFESEGISAGDILSFTRKQALPEGGETTIGVHLAVSATERAPDITLFCCEHLSREILWRPERTAHPNGAHGVTRLIAIEPNPTDFQYLFQAATGDRELRTTSVGMEMDLPNALVSVLSPTAYAAMTGQEVAPWGRGARLVAVEMAFADVEALATRLDGEGIAYEQRGEALVIAPTQSFGLTIIAHEADPS
ncbi:MAG: VOC family protein [Devosiaceae bacterium]|nr:VOC family protein [Devosiaceae bacterium MH13]